MRIRIRIAGLMLAALAAVSACHKEKKEHSPSQEGAGKKIIRVKLMEITAEDFERKITLSASAKAFAEAPLAAETMARVEKIGFEKGDMARQGDPMVWFDAATVRAQLGQARADRDMVKFDYVKQSELKEKGGAVSDYTLEKSRLAMEAAEARIRGLETLLSKYVIHAPISGVVASRDVEVGMVVAPGAPIARIIAVKPIKVSFGVPELEIGSVALGKKARVVFDAHPEREYEGTVSYVAAEVNRTARVFEAEAQLANQDGSIRPEMSAKVTISGKAVKNAISIPQTAVVEMATGHVAFVVGADKTARLKKIEIADYSGGMALVKSGLAAGDRLVIKGHRDLIDGDLVEIGE